ncbi:AAA domain-containing protein [Paracoccus actinidiae]|uniref:AAA domain-containing protein n=1 Tax=Paracoccus actinidiae TaxID=3064531 RepID=UPI0027D3453B|nr:AAA domain-containing protein [Paracoccus sp. M09]
MTKATSGSYGDGVPLEDRRKLAGILGFSRELLNARTKVQMMMGAGLGLFREADLGDVPGLHLDCGDGAWMRIDRLRETRPPEPPQHVLDFLVSFPADPNKPPQVKPSAAFEFSVDEAADLLEYGLVHQDNVYPITEKGVAVENRVKAVIHLEDLEETAVDLDRYIRGPWADWAARERPVRRSIGLYNNLFKIHSAIHTAEATPPELVWGIGLGRWDVRDQQIDMPLIEQLVDIEIEAGSSISIRPRNLQPVLSLKPYLELEIDGAATLQRSLQVELARFLEGDFEFSPFTTGWEPLLATASAQLSETGRHLTRTEIDTGTATPALATTLTFSSTWAIYGRPRSSEARAQDLEALLKQVDNEERDIPKSIRGYAATPSRKSNDDDNDWGIDTAVIGGAGRNTWTAPASGSRESGASSGASRAAARPGAQEDPTSRRVHFFPLPFNEEQGKISNMIDDPKIDVVCVSGPPGTGKSHSIANIISHQMATGKRVLVTARTPEAIAAVREKLPKALQPLVIASTGTDRDSAQQLQDAVTELSNTVVSLDKAAARDEQIRLENSILDCDREAEEADLRLAEIARANLAPLTWMGKEHPPMELVEILREGSSEHGWFTDRPKNAPPAQLADVILRLRKALPELAADIVYAGASLPAPSDLPTTPDLIEAHQKELAWNTREAVDYSGAPVMALDTVGAAGQARMLLNEIEACADLIGKMSERERILAISAMGANGAASWHEIVQVRDFIEARKELDLVEQVRFSLGACAEADFAAAVQRGAAGQKPVGFSLFNGALKQAVASVTFRGAAPQNREGWQAVAAACRIGRDRDEIAVALKPLVDAEAAPSLPETPWDTASYLKNRQGEIATALSTAERLIPCVGTLTQLFPYGLDILDITKRIDCSSAILALKANLPDDYQTPSAILALRAIAGKGDLPVLSAMADLAAALGQKETDPRDIITLRGEITAELTRLADVAGKLDALGRDLDLLAECGAPQWKARLISDPLAATELIPEGWQAAWAWAEMSGRIERIIELGNGDDHRARKADAMQRRRRLFEELIRIRTLLGLSRRMTPSVRSAMEAFSQAVRRIGTGKGKKAPRYIRAAQEAALEASSAAPVWIMPEYRIPEQLPPVFGDFDLVILDEASQSDITAIAALARGKKILIVGDEEQVSPTAVGVPMQKINALRAQYLDGVPNAGLLDENSSIFEITKRMHPDSHVMLREHFRCVAPIIQFSTRFYNNALVPLRVPKASERFDPPLCDVFIEGAIRQGKTNASEAQWIVDEIANLIKDPAHAGRDIGIISLIGPEQAEKIGRMLIEDPRIGPEVIEARRIIYGDARTMQGQERSIVFLSMVATPGKVVSQATKDAQQRINVAMSRARDRLYLVRSVSLGDLKSGDIKRDVIQHFMDPMPDGRVSMAHEAADLLDRCDSGFEREVLSMLMEANYRVRPQVQAGAFRIDLVVEGDDDRRLAIELDGDSYHGPEVWERDMLRQAQLQRAGWTFWRVFGSQWNANKAFWWKNLQEALARMQIGPIGAAALDERFTHSITINAFGASGAEVEEETDLGDLSAMQDTFLPAGRAEGQTEMRTHELFAPAPAAPEPAAPAVDGTMPSIHQKPRSAGRDVEKPALQRERPPVRPARCDHLQMDLLGRLEASPLVSVGRKVALEGLRAEGGKTEITIVESGHDPDMGLIGVHTPLGQALIDAQVGEDVEYLVSGQRREVRVLAVL